MVGVDLFVSCSGQPDGAQSVERRPLHLDRRSAASTSTLGLLLDPLSLSFVLLITGVGSLIHIYSIGYMAHDPAGAGSSRT